MILIVISYDTSRSMKNSRIKLMTSSGLVTVKLSNLQIQAMANIGINYES